MQIITLITDFGAKDFYVAALKGQLLQAVNSLSIQDVTHQISPFDIIETSIALRNTWSHFPKGTIHICTVTTGDDPNDEWMAIELNDHYFLLPNNGLFSLAFPHEKPSAYRLNEDSGGAYGCFMEAVAHIASDKPFFEIGLPVENVVERITLQPVVGPDFIRGDVIHVDHFGNVMTNITRALFDEVGHGRNSRIYFRKIEPIESISQAYSDVPIGEHVCLFNSSGLLEVAVNMGNLAQLYSLDKDSTIQIEFYDKLQEQLKEL